MPPSSSPWSPQPWLAAVFNLILAPLGFIYAKRILLGIGWASLVLCIGMAGLLLFSDSLAFTLLLWSLNIVAAILGFRLARSFTPIPIKSRTRQAFATLGVFLCIWLSPVIAMKLLRYEPMQMPSSSMSPAVKNGSIVLIDRRGFGNYRFFGSAPLFENQHPPIKRGDMATFHFPPDPSMIYLKRIVGIPGDLVEYKNKILVVNGKTITQLPVNAQDTTRVETLDGRTYTVSIDPAADPIWLEQVALGEMGNALHRSQCDYAQDGFSCRLPAGMYFAMGDNRDSSNDSRYWGFVPANHLTGVVDRVL